MPKLKLDEPAQAGFDAPPNATPPYLATSPNWYAWKIGVYLRASGRSRPTDVRMGRGSLVRVRDMSFRVPVDGAIERLT